MSSRILQFPPQPQTTAIQVTDSAARHAPYMEHRWGTRRPCRARVCVSAGGGIAGTGRIRDVSMSGAFLESPLRLPLYAQVAIAVLNDDGSRHVIEFTATVVRTERDGVGIEWCETASGSICELMGCALDCARSGRG